MIPLLCHSQKGNIIRRPFHLFLLITPHSLWEKKLDKVRPSYGAFTANLFFIYVMIMSKGAFGKVYRGELTVPGDTKFDDIAIKTIKSKLN